MPKGIAKVQCQKDLTPYIPNTSRILWDLNYIGKSKMHSSIRIKGMCKNMDFIFMCVCGWVLLGFYLIGLVLWGRAEGEERIF